MPTYSAGSAGILTKFLHLGIIPIFTNTKLINYMRRFLALFTMLMLCGVVASAQNRVVSGKVIDKDGASVAFASVRIKGTKTGTQADGLGAFSIKVKEGDVLEISAANFKTQEVKVTSQE